MAQSTNYLIVHVKVEIHCYPYLSVFVALKISQKNKNKNPRTFINYAEFIFAGGGQNFVK
jgi:hypothetical protein